MTTVLPPSFSSLAPQPSTAATWPATLRELLRSARLLSGGSTSRVHLVHGGAWGRPVVVKSLDADEARRWDRERFLREVRLTARLAHPGIVPLLDAGEADGLDYYVMPFLEGGSLRDRLAGGALPVAEAVGIAGALAEALHHAHAHDVVHRDVKPDNVLFADGHPVLIDFGIACTPDRAADGRLTAAGLLVGTPTYMSPEQVVEDAVDGRADVYALGGVLYEMLTGVPPFCGRADVVLCRRLHEPAPRPRALRREIPSGVDAAVARALAPDPGERFATAADFGAALAGAHLHRERRTESFLPRCLRWPPCMR